MSDNLDQFRYQTWELDTMVRTIERPVLFLLGMFFPTVREFTTKAIEFDIQEGGKRLAPFVHPSVQGRPVRGRGFAIKTFTPAYIKPTRTLKPAMAFTRQPGEAYGGSLTPRQRMDRLVAEEIAEHGDMIDNRLEWFAAQALTLGQVTVTGDDYPSQVVDFGQNSNLRITIGGGVHWDDTNGVPLDDIEATNLKVRKYSYGAVVDTLVMDGSAWSLFREKMKDNRNFSTIHRLGNSQIQSAPRADIDGELVGNIAGRQDVWVYDGRYEDNDGVMQPYLPAYSCIAASRQAIQGIQYFGAIEDLEAGLVAMKHFVKTKIEFDPSGLQVLSQSAPLVAPKRPNASAIMTVKS